MSENNAETPKFDLRPLVKMVMEDTGKLDPREVSDELLSLIDEADLATLVKQLLPIYVNIVISGERNNRAPKPQTVKTSGISKSWKVQGIRDGWQARLRDGIFTGEVWTTRGQATYDDLIAAAERRERTAKRMHEVARDFRNQASAILEAGVKCLDELPAEQQMKVLGVPA